MIRVYLFQVNYAMGSGAFSSQSLPYSIATAWAYSEQFSEINDNFEVVDCFFKREPIDTVVEQIENPDICFFSNYIWNEHYNLTVAREIKNKWPSAKIVFGGPQVDDKEDAFLARNSFVDTAIINEGEVSLYTYLLDFLAGTVKRNYKSKNRLELGSLPSPYLDSNLLKRIVDKNPNTKFSTTIETNRGCPFACTFCDWGGLTHSKIKQFNLEKVFQELDWIAENKIEYVFVADANFGVFYERDKLIVEYLANLKKKTGYPHNISATWYKNSAEKIIELVKILHEAGLNRGLTLSVQSMNDQTLQAIERKNMEVSQLEKMYKECDKQGVTYYTEFILGMPYETLESWKEGICSATQMGCHYFLDIYPLDILRNSELTNQIDKHKIEVMEYSSIFGGQLSQVPEMHNYAISTAYMSRQDYIDSWLWAWLVINFHHYGWTQVLAKFAKKHLDIDFVDFYNDFYKNCVLKDEFFQSLHMIQKNDLEDFFWKNKVTDAFFNDNIVVNYKQIEWHKHRSLVQETISNWAQKYFEGVDKTLLDDVIKFNNLYVVNIERNLPINEEFNFNVHEYCNLSESLLQVNKIYKFKNRLSWIDEDDFKEKLYYKNRSGFSVQIII